MLKPFLLKPLKPKVNLADVVANALAEKWFDRALDAWPVHNIDLDQTTLLKAHPDSSNHVS